MRVEKKLLKKVRGHARYVSLDLEKAKRGGRSLHENNLIQLGIYNKIDGKSYACFFFPENKKAEAQGPLDRAGTTGIIQVDADSEEEARQELAQKLRPGAFK